MRLILTVIPNFQVMEAEVKEVIKEKEYVHGDHDYYDYDRDRDRFASKGVAGM